MSKHDYDHCRSCSAPLNSYSDVYCPKCRERVDALVRKLVIEMEARK